MANSGRSRLWVVHRASIFYRAVHRSENTIQGHMTLPWNLADWSLGLAPLEAVNLRPSLACALTGHLVCSSIHIKNPASAASEFWSRCISDWRCCSFSYCPAPTSYNLWKLKSVSGGHWYLLAEKHTIVLEDAAKEFKNVYSKCPNRIEHLAQANLISSIPEEPHGGWYLINSQQGAGIGIHLLFHTDLKFQDERYLRRPAAGVWS